MHVLEKNQLRKWLSCIICVISDVIPEIKQMEKAQVQMSSDPRPDAAFDTVFVVQKYVIIKAFESRKITGIIVLIYTYTS